MNAILAKNSMILANAILRKLREKMLTPGFGASGLLVKLSVFQSIEKMHGIVIGPLSNKVKLKVNIYAQQQFLPTA